jgi:hypothetical protein
MATAPFVLDNSVLCGWILANQANPYSDAVGELLGVVDAHAPPLLQLEFTNLITQLAPQQPPWGHRVVHKYQSGHGPQRDPVPERPLPA